MSLLSERVKHITIIVLCGVAAWGIWNNAQWGRKWAERDASEARAAQQWQEERASLEAAYRDKERQQALQAAENDRKHQAELASIKERADRMVRDYRNGNLRLRQSIQCTARRAGEAGKANAPAAVSDAASQCGLPTEIVPDLIYLARDADSTAEQVTALQRQICDYYQAINGETLNYEVCTNEEKDRKGKAER